VKDQDEQSWHPDGADVPRWVVPAAAAALVVLLVLVVLAVRA
jgi:hypothetical protein